jgi:N-glycosylase/DNA lyase
MSTYQTKKNNEEIRRIHGEIGGRVENRLREFRRIWKNADDTALFVELVFCLLTPQSGARRCWRAVENLLREGTLFTGNFDEICRELNIVRFKNNKTSYILEARDAFYGPGKSLRNSLCACSDALEKREWLFRNVKGLGCKEASHYLRNIGLGEGLAILDRHILRSMHAMGLIDRIPASISPLHYRDMEMALEKYARKIRVPLAHLDFVIWYRATGDIFK